MVSLRILRMNLINSTTLIILILLVSGISFAQSKEYKQMPFYLDNDQIIVEGLFKGQPIKLALSTKLPSSINFPKFSKYLRKSILKSQEKDELYITYTPVTVVSGIKIGDVKINRLKMFFDGMWKLPHQTSVEIDGILGHDFFNGKIVQISYKDKLIRIYKKNPYTDFIKSKPNGNNVISLIKLKVKKPYLPYQDSFTVTDNIVFRNSEINMLIDLNQKSKFTLSENFNTSLVNANILKNFKLGSFTFKEFKTELVKSFENQETHNAALGSEFFQNYILTLDYKKKWMILEEINTK